MVSGEHLRPLAGFVVVCGVAALIMTTGLTDPAALRRIVSEQRVLPSPSLTELVLGRTFDPAPRRGATRSAQQSVPGPAAETRASLVLSTAPQTIATATGHAAPAHAGHPHKASAASTQETATAPTTAAQPADGAPSVVAQPVSLPSSQPVSSPVTSTPHAVASASTHHSVQASTSADQAEPAVDTRGRSHGHRQDHSRADDDRHRGQHGSQVAHQAPQQSHAVPAADPQPPSATGTGGDTRPLGEHGHDHSHGGYAQGDHSHDDHLRGDHSHGDHSRGHNH